MRFVAYRESRITGQTGVIQADHRHRAQVIVTDEHRLSSGVLAGGAHPLVVEADQLIVSGGVLVLEFEALTGPFYEAAASVLCACPWGAGGGLLSVLVAVAVMAGE